MPVFGRGFDCDVVVDDDACSLRHASTSLKSEGVRIQDLGSSNGTFLNGVRIESAILQDDDEIRMGETRFVFKGGRLELGGPHLPEGHEPRTPARTRLRLGAVVLFLVGVVSGVIFISSREANTDVSGGTIPIATSDGGSNGSADLFAAPPGLGDLVARVSGSVLSVKCGDSTGSGWPISVASEVRIVTNHHVIEECLRRKVQVSTSTVNASVDVLASDPGTDLAILTAPANITPLPTGPLPPIGSWMMLIGNPLGLERSVSYGSLNNISGGLLIVDAAINPGSSGGPAFDSQGRVVGTASAKIATNTVDRVGIVIGVAELCVGVLVCGGSFPG